MSRAWRNYLELMVVFPAVQAIVGGKHGSMGRAADNCSAERRDEYGGIQR